MENRLETIVNDYFNTSEYKIIEFLLRGEGGTKVAEIFVDNENGLNIDELAKINRELNQLLDDDPEISNISKLVVSSPGAERSFKYLWQIKKHSGRLLEIELNNGEKIEGKLLETDPDKELITVGIIKKEKGRQVSEEVRIINFSNIKESKVKLSFSK